MHSAYATRRSPRRSSKECSRIPLQGVFMPELWSLLLLPTDLVSFASNNNAPSAVLTRCRYCSAVRLCQVGTFHRGCIGAWQVADYCAQDGICNHVVVSETTSLEIRCTLCCTLPTLPTLQRRASERLTSASNDANPISQLSD